MGQLLKDEDRLFAFFVGALFGVMVLFGSGMFVIALWGDDGLALRMLTVFAGMFSGILGLGSGYLLGARTNGRRNGNGG